MSETEPVPSFAPVVHHPVPPLVLYHANCPDGFCAAWVANRLYGKGGAEFVPVHYGTPPPDVAARRVFVLDFSYPPPVLKAMIGVADRVVVLDHHKTAADALLELSRELPLVERPRGAAEPVVTFDMEKSGGRLAWEFFFSVNHRAPWLVDYTEDRDLWRWVLPHSRAVNAFLASHPRTFENWDTFDLTRPGDRRWDRWIAEGDAILRYQGTLVDAACRTAVEIELNGHRVLAAHTTVLQSEVAGKLAEGRPFGVAWFIRDGRVAQWSLRSRKGGVDVSEIARAYGGGGHKSAAGFEAEWFPRAGYGYDPQPV